ncbi:hypothetical protein RN51_01735 [Microbacterium oxydans]|uniref:Uncharacterized protein n=1 Tax=Microbacterium oxydans TaxID=82380 RepID=A0A0F0KR82_9MICO|nr:hypothetical protein RN51_01735 [Microbacterium oxydans]
MIQDEAQFRLLSDRLYGGRKLAGSNEQVVAQAAAGHLLEATLHVLPQQPSGIGLVVDLVTHTHQCPRRGVDEPIQSGAHGRINEVYPADHAAHPRGARGGREELLRLGELGDGLHEHGGVDAVAFQRG